MIKRPHLTTLYTPLPLGMLASCRPCLVEGVGYDERDVSAWQWCGDTPTVLHPKRSQRALSGPVGPPHVDHVTSVMSAGHWYQCPLHTTTSDPLVSSLHCHSLPLAISSLASEHACSITWLPVGPRKEKISPPQCGQRPAGFCLTQRFIVGAGEFLISSWAVHYTHQCLHLPQHTPRYRGLDHSSTGHWTTLSAQTWS